ncbi:MAG: N-acyl homoserine lactonase family protein [Alphaproteobacteria bacterium]|nr:N-acyl homoserine lactonase family protein [Alphaproteobacteria bacterium]
MSQYSIWVLEYSYVRKFHRSAVVYGTHNQGHVKLPYCYTVIKGNGHVAMVDVGYNDKDHGKVMADTLGVEAWQSPRTVLAEIGLKPEDVDSIFISHAHFDHFGNVEAFPKATFYIQEREIAKWVWAMALPERMRWVLQGIDVGDIMRGVELARDRRLACVDGDVHNVLPGIDLHAAPDTHTYGSMWVKVRNDGREDSQDVWVLAGDLVYQLENLGDSGAGGAPDGQYIPIGLATGSQTNLIMAVDQMVRAVGNETRRVIPIHEERLAGRFPHRISRHGLRISEVCLAEGQASLVR